MAADDKSLKIAARLVCTDQWLVTHVDPSWPIVQLKQYLLHKFRQDGSDADQNPRAIPVSPRKARRRSLSPITFAAPVLPRKAKAPPVPPTSPEESSLSDASVDDDDDVNITKSFTDAHRYKYSARPSTSSASESVTRILSDGGPDPQAYVLLTFSTTQILEDRFSLSWYAICPDELLELHPASVSFVSLQRCSLDAYIAPYFAARVWALRIVGNKLEGPPSVLRKRYGEDEAAAEGKAPGARDRGKRKVAVEWKERWAIIHQGVFSLCKERHDTHTAFSAPLSSLLAIRDSAHFTLPLHARRLRQKSSSPPASNVVCLKFGSSSTARRRTFSNESASVTFERRPSDPHASSSTPSGPGSQGAWWRRGSRDVSTTLSLGLTSSASILVGSGNMVDAWDSFARRGSRTGLDDSEGEGTPPKEKGKGKARDDDEDSVWIVLDTLDSSACSHILRVLHRQAPTVCHSTFLPSRTPSVCSPASSPITFNACASTPATPISPTTPGPSSSSNFHYSPILSPGAVGPSPLPSVAPSFTPSFFPHAHDSRTSSPAVKLPAIDTSVTARSLGVQYPSWRLSLVRKARRAGLGAVGRAMELVMFGDEDEDDIADLGHMEDDDELAIEWAHRTSSVASPIEPPPSTSSPILQSVRPREHFMFPPKHASDPAFKSIPEEGPAPEPGPDTPSELEPAPVLEQLPRSHRTTHPFPLGDLTSLYSTEHDTLQDSDPSEVEWDGWVDALVAQQRQETLHERARARRDTLVSPGGLDTVISGNASTIHPADAGRSSIWGSGWSSRFGGSKTSLSQVGSPDREHADEEGGTWDWVHRSDAEVDAETEESSAHSSDPNAGPMFDYHSRGTTSSSRGKRPKTAPHTEGHGKTLSSYSSADSLLKRTMRTNIKSIKNLSLSQAKRASMNVLFPSASKSDVNLNPDVPPRAASVSPPPSQHLSRPSLTSMRSTTSMSTRSRPFSPLSGQLPENQYDDDDDDDDEGVADADEHEGDADVDDVDEETEGEGYMDSELAHDSQFTGGHHPVPMPGMRMVPAGYTTFQHSSLYGRAQQGGQEREQTHAGIVHGQSMQKLPMGMARMLTTVSSTVSVGPSARRGATR